MARDVARGPGARLVAGLRTLPSTGLRLGRRGVYVWRRSLQLRVVATTVLLGMVVVGGLGGFLLQQISTGLFDARQARAQQEAANGTAQLQQAFIETNQTDLDGLDQLVQQLLPQLQGVGPEGTGVLLLPGPEAEAPGIREVARGDLDASDIPDDLRQAVAASDAQQLTPVALSRNGGEVPGLVVGSTVAAPGILGPYELYFVFSLQDEQETLELVERILAIGGVVLVLLVGAVAFVVTRQVVSPVRLAARVAEQLSSGHLDQRLQVHGDDDLARLARSFNEMAHSLQQQIHQLEELSRLQRRFVSDVSHELRTPLTTIRMAGEVIHESRHDFQPAVSRSAELLTTQLDRFESLLTDLLEISRFDAGAAALDAEPTDVRDVVARVVEVAAPLAERRGSPVLVHAPPAPCMAEVDDRRLERIVRNLVVNAIEHGEGRPIEVSVDADADAVAVLVRDHGVGLSDSETEMVFSRFWRADPARARATGGTGLGLAIALEDAHLHGGWLQAHGEPGRGAAFRLTLPRRAGSVLTSSPIPLHPPGVAVLPPAHEEHSGASSSMDVSVSGRGHR